MLSPAEKERHPWFTARRRVIAGELDRIGPVGDALDAGCGAGLMLEELAGRARSLAAVDADPAAVAAARARAVADVHTAPVERLPFPDGSFDLITSFDVLEHTADDAAALAELRRVARPGADLLVAVPALPALWSGHDQAAGHRRRYRRGQLEAAARRQGWALERVTHFNVLLLAPMAVVRVASRWAGRAPRSDLLTLPRSAGVALRCSLAVEERALRAGLRPPIGLSLMARFRATR